MEDFRGKTGNQWKYYNWEMKANIQIQDELKWQIRQMRGESFESHVKNK